MINISKFIQSQESLYPSQPPSKCRSLSSLITLWVTQSFTNILRSRREFPRRTINLLNRLRLIFHSSELLMCNMSGFLLMDGIDAAAVGAITPMKLLLLL